MSRLRNAAFRGYADYMQTDAFALAVDALIREGSATHRAHVQRKRLVAMPPSLLADYLSSPRGWNVYDLCMTAGSKRIVLLPGCAATAIGFATTSCSQRASDRRRSAPVPPAARRDGGYRGDRIG